MSRPKDIKNLAIILQVAFLAAIIVIVNRELIPGSSIIFIITVCIIVILSSILFIDWFERGQPDRPTKVTSEGISHYPRGALTFHKWGDIKYFQLEYNEIRRYQSFNDLYTLYIVFKDGRESVQIYDTTSNKEELKSLATTLVDRMRLALLLPYDKKLLYEVNLKNGKPTVSNYLSDDSWSPKFGPY